MCFSKSMAPAITSAITVRMLDMASDESRAMGCAALAHIKRLSLARGGTEMADATPHSNMTCKADKAVQNSAPPCIVCSRSRKPSKIDSMAW